MPYNVPMTALQRFLLVVALFVAQAVAGMHAVEHGVAKDGGLPDHVCELCLAAHDLGSALPSVVALPPVAADHEAPADAVVSGLAALPAPVPRQGAPPNP